MKAVILAAGDNTRFRRENSKHNKLLYPVLGIPLIERTIKSAKMAGIEEFIVITGYQDDKIKKFLGRGERLGVRIEYVYNQRWEGENGMSVYVAKEKIDENFILLMGDHLFAPKSLARLRRIKLDKNEVLLATDRKEESALNINEATKVKIIRGKIVAIGKELEEFNALDTGMFLCSPYLFSILEKTINQKKFYLTDAMRILKGEGKLRSYDIKDGFWADIDIKEDLKFAESKLFKFLTKPSEEGPISKYFNRHFSHVITRIIIRTPLTPNQLTFLSLVLAIISGLFLVNPSYPSVLAGSFLAQLSSIVDGVDGEVARIKLESSNFGAWFDTILDRYGDIAIVTGAAIGVYLGNPSGLAVFIGVLALTGSILSSYSSHTLKTAFGQSFSQMVRLPFTLPSGRDMRLFIIFIGGIFNLLLPALGLIAFLTHYSVFSKLFSLSQLQGKSQ